MKAKRQFLLVVVILLFTTSCSMYSYEAFYQEPNYEIDKDQYSVVLDKTFDEVWSDLIAYSASTFFAIDNFEKASGLITLSFGASGGVHNFV